MGRFQSPQARQAVSTYLQSTSYRNKLASAAIQAIHRLDDSAFIPELLTTLREGEGRFASWDYSTGLDTLAHIDRDQEDRTQVREFLAGYVNHPRMAIRRGAIRALGTLGDPKAIPVVETFCGQEPYDQIQRQAKATVDTLQEKKLLVPEEVLELRKTVDELKKETDKLKKELDDLKKQTQAKTEASPAAGVDSSKAAEDDREDTVEP